MKKASTNHAAALAAIEAVVGTSIGSAVATRVLPTEVLP
jgi:hypothetical protein